MKAIGFTEFGGPEVLTTLDLPEPHPGPGQVRVKVAAFHAIPVDELVRSGGIKQYEESLGHAYAEPPYVLGWDISGVIDEVGPSVVGFAPGDAVVGVALDILSGLGSHAEYVVTAADRIVRAPQGKDHAELVTFPLNAFTAYVALEKVALRPGETLYVSGAAGGVGQHTVRLAKRLGLRVVVDAKDSDKLLLRDAGADIVVSRGDGVAQRILDAVPGGVDAVIDNAQLHEAILPAVRDDGRIVTLRYYVGDEVRGITWLPFSVIPHLGRGDVLQELTDLVATSELTTPVAEIFPADRAADANRKLAAGGTRGQIVLTW